MPDPSADPATRPAPDLAVLGADVQWTDREAGRRAAAALPASAGRLAALADWLASVQATVPPRPPARVRLVRFGPAAGSGADALAADLDVGVRTVDELPAAAGDAVSAGVSVADREVDSGADLVIAACPGAGLAAAVAIALLTDTEPVRVLASGPAATDPPAWMRRATRVRDLRRTAAQHRDRPGDLLAALDDPALAAAAGFVLQAAVRRTAVLLDGTGAAAAALVAYQAQTRLVRWLAVADTTPDPGHGLAVTTLGLRTLLDLGLGDGDGTAGLLALPVLRAAARRAAAEGGR